MRGGEVGTAEIERSLRLLPYWWVRRWAWLSEALWVIYLIETRGLTIGQVLLLDAVFFGSQLLAEIPTGVVADDAYSPGPRFSWTPDWGRLPLRRR